MAMEWITAIDKRYANCLSMFLVFIFYPQRCYNYCASLARFPPFPQECLSFNTEPGSAVMGKHQLLFTNCLLSFTIVSGRTEREHKIKPKKAWPSKLFKYFSMSLKRHHHRESAGHINSAISGSRMERMWKIINVKVWCQKSFCIKWNAWNVTATYIRSNSF